MRKCCTCSKSTATVVVPTTMHFKNLEIAAFVFLVIVDATSAQNQVPRVFSEDFIEGLYGRFFEYTEDGASSPCPRVIDHFNRGFPSASGESWTIPHDRIVQNGVKCDDRGVLTLSPFDSSSTLPDRLKQNPMAVETFNIMRRNSTGFWMGADARTCGKWVFQNPSFVFFVKEFERALTTSFRLDLAAGQRYMFVVAPKFTCIYIDVPRSSPDPNVVLLPGDITAQPTGSSGDESRPKPSPTISVQEDSNATSPPTSDDGDSDDADGSNDESNAVEEEGNAASTSSPQRSTTPTPNAETILDILDEENDDDNDPIAAVINDAGPIIETDGEILDDGSSLCFPGSALVELKSGRAIRMDQLSVGDEVLVGELYSQVFGFTHKSPHTTHRFIRLTTKCGKSVTLTAGHYLYANDRLVAAKTVQQGDRIRLTNREAIVDMVDTILETGLYNPQTLHGDLVVNGIITSCYTTAVSKWSAHALLTPLRALWQVYPMRILSSLEKGPVHDGFAWWWEMLSHITL